MFVINIYLRFALIALFLGGGIALSFIYGIWWALPLLIVGIILIVGYLLLGTVMGAGKKMQAMDFDGAERHLGLTYFPKLLFGPNRAYYYMLLGSLALNKKENDKAQNYLTVAKETGLPSDNEKAMVDLQLANLAAARSKWPQAKKYYQDIKTYKVTEPQLKSQIEEFGKAIKQSGNLRNVNTRRQAHQMNMGGTRRRPKAR